MILGGVYLLALISTPLILSQNIDPKDNHTTQLITKTENKITENRLYIPKIDINLPYSTGDAETMEHGAWWRKPENGNPKDGGNFVLSAHRFIMGLTPQQMKLSLTITACVTITSSAKNKALNQMP